MLPNIAIPLTLPGPREAKMLPEIGVLLNTHKGEAFVPREAHLCICTEEAVAGLFEEANIRTLVIRFRSVLVKPTAGPVLNIPPPIAEIEFIIEFNPPFALHLTIIILLINRELDPRTIPTPGPTLFLHAVKLTNDTCTPRVESGTPDKAKPLLTLATAFTLALTTEMEVLMIGKPLLLETIMFAIPEARVTTTPALISKYANNNTNPPTTSPPRPNPAHHVTLERKHTNKHEINNPAHEEIPQQQ